jgi:hypothetical protein
MVHVFGVSKQSSRRERLQIKTEAMGTTLSAASFVERSSKMQWNDKDEENGSWSVCVKRYYLFTKRSFGVS